MYINRHNENTLTGKTLLISKLHLWQKKRWGSSTTASAMTNVKVFLDIDDNAKHNKFQTLGLTAVAQLAATSQNGSR